MAGNKALSAFAARWNGRGYEKGEAVQFWIELQEAVGYPHVHSTVYEHHLDNGGYVDAWLRDGSVIVEQKGLGVDLDKPELRQGAMKTPLMQALDYVDELKPVDQPRYVVTCNFATFRVYDRNAWSRSQLEKHPFEFTLEELAAHPEYLSFLTDPVNARFEKEKEISIRAGAAIGRLYDRLAACYIDPDAPSSRHALNVLCVRIVFCLFCEDADLFERNAFYNYLNRFPAPMLRSALRRLFRALDTPVADRDPYDTDVNAFPYVNGGLFRGEVEIPNIDEATRSFLLDEISAGVDWSDISPTIFGGIFESTLNPETRRQGGMHYTSPENIHKVIDPLFLDALESEFSQIRSDVMLTPRQKRNRLAKLHERICAMRFLDPACGSGNFLTETYLCLRRLEDSILRELRQGQMALAFADEEESGKRVSLAQFYGIEINDFAVTVAQAALWISRLKANGETMMMVDVDSGDFPLDEAANIVHANALRIDWNDVLPANQCSYIIGNPPFIGHNVRSDAQKDDMTHVFGGYKTGKTDYVICWFFLAAKYMAAGSGRIALVATNSICQGESVGILWPLIFKLGYHIDFAWTTFVWNNEATEQAHVHVVIVGYSRSGKEPPRLFADDNAAVICNNINGYLIDAPNVCATRRTVPISDVPKIKVGSLPRSSAFTVSKDERPLFIKDNPICAEWIRPYIGADEFLNGGERYCLWLKDAADGDIARCPMVLERVETVRADRLASPAATTRNAAKTPKLFAVDAQPETAYLVVPQVSSQRRTYLPIGFMQPEIIASNLVFIIPDATMYHFGIMSSLVHNAWMRVTCGRMKSDYRYGGDLVYNNFVWPNPTSNQRDCIETCAHTVLDIRESYPDKTLADLYDPDKMPVDLLAAHKALDKAVEDAYGVDFEGDEEKIVAHLFKLYAEATKELK